MGRDTVASVTSANAAPQIHWAMLAKINLTSTTLYMTTGTRFIYDGVNTYTPVGGLGGVEPIIEESTLFPRALKIWMSAVGSANLAEPMSENLFNKPVRMYRCTLTGSMTIVGTPQQCFRGYINKCDVVLGDAEKGNYFELEVESRIRREASSNFYTKENHDQMLGGVYSGDTFFNYVPRIQGFQSKWGDGSQTLSGLAPEAGGSGPRGHGGGNRGGR